MQNDNLFLRSKDVAHLLDCSPDDIYRVMQKGNMPAIKRGKFWLFRYEDVMAYKEQAEKARLTVANSN